MHAWLDECCAAVPELVVVRNDVYARLSHRAYNKATVLAEISRRVGARPDEVLAAGDHFNDLPMLAGDCATRLVAPGNAGTATEAKCRNISIAATNIEALLEFAKLEQVAFTVVGPEAPLVIGVVDLFRENGLKIWAVDVNF